MARGLLAALLGAIAMFVWGFVSWTVLSIHDIKGFENGPAAQETLRGSGDESGVYWVPSPPTETDPESASYKMWKDAHERGPIAMVVLHKEGAEVMDPMVMVKGFVTMFLACLVAVLLLSRANVKEYLARVLFVTGIGLVAAIHADGGQWAWFYFPTEWTLGVALDRVIAWAVAGFVMGAVVKGK